MLDRRGRKEGRKARRYRRGGGNPAGFNHRSTRRRGSTSAFYPFAPSPPHSEEVSKLLSSTGLPRDGRGGGRGPRGLVRGASDRRYADRAYLELADASQSIYLAKAPLDRCPGSTPPRYLPPATGERDEQRGGRGDEIVCRRARAHEDTSSSNRCRKDQF